MPKLSKTQANALILAGAFAGSTTMTCAFLAIKQRRDAKRRDLELKVVIIRAHLVEVLDLCIDILEPQVTEAQRQQDEQEFNKMIEEF